MELAQLFEVGAGVVIPMIPEDDCRNKLYMTLHDCSQKHNMEVATKSASI
jgi:hypothetical protein